MSECVEFYKRKMEAYPNLREISGEKKDKYLDLARELKKHESDDCTNCDWCFRHNK